jgi:hypothetical protein
MNLSKNEQDRLIIHTSWQMYMFMLGLPIFLIVLDFISALMSQTKFSYGILNVATVIFLTLFVLSSRLLIVSKDSIISWPSLIFGKKILINDINQIDVRVDVHYTFSGGGMVPILTMYFKNSNAEVMGKLSITTFDKKSMANFFRKVSSLNPGIVFNDKAKELANGDDILVKKEITNAYSSLVHVLLLIFILAFVVSIIAYLAKSL